MLSSAQISIANTGKLYYEYYAILTELLTTVSLSEKACTLLPKAKFLNHVQVQTLILLKSTTRPYKLLDVSVTNAASAKLRLHN